MSADNYYCVKRAKDGLWYLYHGSMSMLEDGFPATRLVSEGLSTREEALALYNPSAWEFYSEYGLIEEGETMTPQEQYEKLTEWYSGEYTDAEIRGMVEW